MISFANQIVSPTDQESLDLISTWYFQEWNIPVENTIKNQLALAEGDCQFQAILLKDAVPIGTGGIYNHVGLIDREPRFGAHKHWLALVYTKPEFRGKGYGTLICRFIQHRAKVLGLQELFLFTHTAESLYRRLGWQEIERLQLEGRNIVVMRLDL